jgi:hypothetical protein
MMEASTRELEVGILIPGVSHLKLRPTLSTEQFKVKKLTTRF